MTGSGERRRLSLDIVHFLLSRQQSILANLSVIAYKAVRVHINAASFLVCRNKLSKLGKKVNTGIQ